MVVSGTVSSDELAARSLIGKYYFPCLGENEKLLEAAGLKGIEAIDTTAEAAQVAKRWHDSRAQYKEELQEPASNFDSEEVREGPQDPQNATPNSCARPGAAHTSRDR